MVNRFLQKLIRLVSQIGADPKDGEDLRLQKTTLVASSIMICFAGILWGLIYFLFGETLPALIPLAYSLFSLLGILYFARSRRYSFFRFWQLLLILLLPFALMISLGGFIGSSAVILWSLFSPLLALLLNDPRSALRWLFAYLGLVLISGLLQPQIRAINILPPWAIITFFVINICAISSIAFILLYYFVGQKNSTLLLLREEQARSESLLLNVLPKEIAVRLKGGNQVIADFYQEASILFADLVGFTPLSAELAPAEMVEVLNDIYSHFDALVEKYNLEKIRTIGDNYMIASGLPSERTDHAQALARLSLEMRAYLEERSPIRGHRLQFRFGINSGPVIAGVIGYKKFAYDVWGDTVNTASRMESQGEPGQIQITCDTYNRLKDEFICESHGSLPIKGKGLMETWFLVAAKQPSY